jgi:hypothetical protein
MYKSTDIFWLFDWMHRPGKRSSLPPNVVPKHFVPSNLYQPASASGSLLWLPD